MSVNGRLAMWGFMLGLAGASLARAADTQAGLAACRDLTDAAARLACYDREAAGLPRTPTVPPPAHRGPAAAASGSPPPPAAPGGSAPTATTVENGAQAAAAAPKLTPEQQFGLPAHKVADLEVAAGTRPREAQMIEAHIAVVTPRLDGHTVFRLDNQQVWQQLTTDSDPLVKQGQAVTISRGLLGSYWLQFESGRGCKVTRLQ
jgi:hypothetical protein